MRRRRHLTGRLLWFALIVVLLAAGIEAFRLLAVKAERPSYLFGTVERGDVAVQVAASGTLAAVTTVQVGTQVSGTIAALFVDFNSEVKKGQLLARLDPALFQAQVEQQEANVRTAEANLNNDAAAVASAKANLEKAKVDVLDKQRKLKRSLQLFEESLIARDDLDTAQAALDASMATQQAAEAQIASAEAGRLADQARLTQARASLDSANLNLAHTIITSPVSGTIISRSVDRGQTVAASFSSPTLFQIGEDLTKMQVNTNVDEADVAKLRAGMQASFTVDAYSGESFNGILSQIRLAASTVQNVVTYNAIVDVQNPQLRLKPGMTANVKILIRKEEDVLKVPNSALRYKPSLSDQELEAAYQRAGEEGYDNIFKSVADNSVATGSGGSQWKTVPIALSTVGVTRSQPQSGYAGENGTGTPVRTVWTLGADSLLRPVIVTLGLTDGTYTQLCSGKLREGDRVITGIEADATSSAKNTAPTRAPGFGPGMPGGPPPAR